MQWITYDIHQFTLKIKEFSSQYNVKNQHLTNMTKKKEQMPLVYCISLINDTSTAHFLFALVLYKDVPFLDALP